MPSDLLEESVSLAWKIECAAQKFGENKPVMAFLTNKKPEKYLFAKRYI